MILPPAWLRERSLFEFVAAVGDQSLNRRVLESLIAVGAFDTLNNAEVPLTHWRPALLAAIDDALAMSQKSRQDKARGQSGLFFGAADDNTLPVSSAELLKNAPQWSKQELGLHEKAAIGFYLTSHPLADADALLNELGASPISPLPEIAENGAADDKIWFAGVVSSLQIRPTKNGRQFAIFKLEDRTGNIKCIAWADTFQKFSHLLKDEAIVLGSGRLETKEEASATFMLDEIVALDEAKAMRADRAVIMLKTPNPSEGYWEKIFALLNQHPGRCEVLFEMPLLDGGAQIRLRPFKSMQVRGCGILEKALQTHGLSVEWRSRQTVGG